MLKQVAISFSRDLPHTGIDPALAGAFFTTPVLTFYNF